MSEIVNFNKARKARDRAAAKAQAETNRVKFGRSKSEKASAKAEADRAVRSLDGHKRETEN